MKTREEAERLEAVGKAIMAQHPEADYFDLVREAEKMGYSHADACFIAVCV